MNCDSFKIGQFTLEIKNEEPPTIFKKEIKNKNKIDYNWICKLLDTKSQNLI